MVGEARAAQSGQKIGKSTHFTGLDRLTCLGSPIIPHFRSSLFGIFISIWYPSDPDDPGHGAAVSALGLHATGLRGHRRPERRQGPLSPCVLSCDGWEGFLHTWLEGVVKTEGDSSGC